MRWSVWLAIAVGLGGCGFHAPDTGDAQQPVTVGFQAPTSLQDEISGMVTIAVTLSAPAGDVVTVRYHFADGSAVNGADYTGSDGQLTFAPGVTDARIPLTINPDGLEENDESFDVTLDSATNAVLGTSRHTVTISADILPRVAFMTPTSMADESSSQVLDLVLDHASTVAVSVDYVVTGTASGGGTDFTLAAGMVTFPPGTLSRQVTLVVVDDALDEFDENVLVTLTGSSGVVVGTAASHDHTILDNDPEPTVGFSTATRSENESTAAVDLTVQLSAPSGKPILVDVVPGVAAVDPATEDADFSYPATLQLAFAPGTVQKTVTLTLVDDALDEFDETVVTTLAVQAGYNVTLGAISSSALSIIDNDAAPSVELTTASQTVNEGDTGTTPYPYTVTLSAPSGKPITVPIDITGSATPTEDYTITGNPISIAPGTTTGALTINVVGDLVKESSMSGNADVVLTIPTVGLVNVTRGTVVTRTLTIHDDD